jgi:PKD repeat protein
MDQETAYLAALSTAQSFSLEGEALLVNTAQGLIVFTNQGPSAVQPLPPTDTPEAVQPLPTIAVISAPTEGQVAQALTFDGSASTSAAEIVVYQWDLGDGTKVEGISGEHAYAEPGVYTVTLTITDADGNTASATLEITITE